ncbi:MAG: NAD(P)H-binding protein [Opitutus sp.]|nr:NAD(P)H-binding protein [Opitutus sp.]
MKIAVLGAGGLIANRVVETVHLGGRGDVVAIVARENELPRPSRFGLETRIADMADASALTSALTGCDVALFAATDSAAVVEHTPSLVCQAAAAARVPRVIYVGSAFVHGRNPAPNTDETSLLQASSLLSADAAHASAERRFFAECQRLNLAGYALRPGIVYGPRSPFIATVAEDLAAGEAWLYRRGLGIFNGVYVDNLVHAILLCAEASNGAGQAYLISDAETVTWAELYLTASLELDISPRSLHDVQELPEFSPSWLDRAERAVASPVVQRALPLVPAALKQRTKSLLKAWNAPLSTETWSMPQPAQPRITPELGELQRAAWKFPFGRAHRVLGYLPPVKFAEGMRRSFAWWRFTRGETPPAY